MSWGDQEGKQGTPELGQMYKDMIAQWRKGKFEIGMPNGESATELRNRLSDFVNDLKKRKEEKILVCSHGRALRCLICILKNLHLKEMESYRVSNVGLYVVNQKNDSFRIITENSTEHRTPLPK